MTKHITCSLHEDDRQIKAQGEQIQLTEKHKLGLLKFCLFCQHLSSFSQSLALIVCALQ